MWQYLADELATEILTRLPVKYIIRCRCVCKSWRSLISSPYFIASHLRKSNNNNNNTQIFVLQWTRYSRLENHLLHFEDSHQNHHFRSMLLRLQSDSILEFVGCTNGLICFALHSDKLYRNFVILNPEIGCFVSVPAPHNLYIYNGVKGFGFDDTTLDYKIFLAYSENFAYLYSLNSSSWNSIPCPNTWSRNHDDSVVFANGSFHWVAYDRAAPSPRDRPYIMVFDLKSEAFRRISITFGEGVWHEYFTIVQYGNSSIGVIQRIQCNLTHVWVMKNLGHTESQWENLASKVWIGDRRKSRIEAQEVVGFKNDEELLIRFFDGRLMSQNIKNKMVCDLVDTKIHGRKFSLSAHWYAPNLILLDRQNA